MWRGGREGPARLAMRGSGEVASAQWPGGDDYPEVDLCMLVPPRNVPKVSIAVELTRESAWDPVLIIESSWLVDIFRL
jgi:hypothetical protein